MVRGIANSKIGFGDLILLLRYFFKLKVSTHPNYSLNNRALLAQNLIASLPVFSTVISHFRTSGQIKIEDLRAYFISIYPGEESTASRRFSTFMNYIRYLGLPVQ